MENYIAMEPEEKRQRKRTSFDPVTCPVCSITIRESELDQHFKSELEKLGKIKKVVNKSPSTTPPGTSKTKTGESSTSNNAENDENCWDTYQKIKENRVRRCSRVRKYFVFCFKNHLTSCPSQLKNRKRKIEDRACPICSKVIGEDLQLHVELCLKKQEQTSDESDDEIDVGESYSWCGQTRIRATTLVEGNLSATVSGACHKPSEDEDTEVNIDGDDDTQYGSAQYSERDIILLNHDDQRLRDLVIGEDAPSTSGTRETREENNQNVANSASPSTSPSSEKVDFSLDDKIPMSSNGSDTPSDNSSRQIIESLKAKIREYESFIKNKPKCLICLDDFKKPVVSICCWHVHCEECWLYTLGCRKLCPQCNMITSASDLRRIYL